MNEDNFNEFEEYETKENILDGIRQELEGINDSLQSIASFANIFKYMLYGVCIWGCIALLRDIIRWLFR